MAFLPKIGKNREGAYPSLSLRDEVNRVFDDFFGRGWLRSPLEGAWAPAIDVSETHDAVEVTAEVPGIDPADIDISLCGDTLVIKGEKREEEKKEAENYSRVERRYGAFRRAVSLPTACDASRIKATCKDGVLNVRLEKSEATKARSIDIKVE